MYTYIYLQHRIWTVSHYKIRQIKYVVGEVIPRLGGYLFQSVTRYFDIVLLYRCTMYNRDDIIWPFRDTSQGSSNDSTTFNNERETRECLNSEDDGSSASRSIQSIQSVSVHQKLHIHSSICRDQVLIVSRIHAARKQLLFMQRSFGTNARVNTELEMTIYALGVSSTSRKSTRNLFHRVVPWLPIIIRTFLFAFIMYPMREAWSLSKSRFLFFFSHNNSTAHTAEIITRALLQL